MRPPGEENDEAGPTPSVYPDNPVMLPAIVETEFDSINLIALFPVSQTNTIPVLSTATPLGDENEPPTPFVFPASPPPANFKT